MRPQSKVDLQHGRWRILSSLGDQRCNFGRGRSIKDAETEITPFEGVQNRQEGQFQIVRLAAFAIAPIRPTAAKLGRLKLD